MNKIEKEIIRILSQVPYSEHIEDTEGFAENIFKILDELKKEFPPVMDFMMRTDEGGQELKVNNFLFTLDSWFKKWFESEQK